MKKQHILPTILISLLVIIGGIALNSCASGASAQQKSGLEAQVSTAVAATLVQYMIETEVAVQAIALVDEPAAQTTATQAPVPTFTPTAVPTQAAQPTTAPTATAAQPTPTAPAAAAPASGPTITADQDTNCRAGPGTNYRVVTYFIEGDESTVQGRDAGKDWWYIVNPDDASGYCWVWDESTTVVGDTSTVPVVAAPTSPDYKTGYKYSNSYYCNPYSGWCGGGASNCWENPYNNCWKNTNWWKTSNWWTCCPYPYYQCTCKPVCKDPWKKSNCPPVTEVNYKKYCKNYPQCCADK